MSYTGKVGLTFLYFVHSELMELKIYTISVWLYRMLHQALLLLWQAFISAFSDSFYDLDILLVKVAV